MKEGTFLVGLTFAVIVVLLMSEAAPELANWILLLLIVGVLLAGWPKVAPLWDAARQAVGG